MGKMPSRRKFANEKMEWPNFKFRVSGSGFRVSRLLSHDFALNDLAIPGFDPNPDGRRQNH